MSSLHKNAIHTLQSCMECLLHIFVGFNLMKFDFRSIMVEDLQTDQKSIFIADRWLALDKDDGEIEIFISDATEEELKDFSYLFSTKTRFDLTDAHLWFSVYARPPRSLFTRCQRFSVAVTSLFCAMLTSLMFYRVIPRGEPAKENQVGAFSFTWRQVMIFSIPPKYFFVRWWFGKELNIRIKKLRFSLSFFVNF